MRINSSAGFGTKITDLCVVLQYFDLALANDLIYLLVHIIDPIVEIMLLLCSVNGFVLH